MSDLNKIRKMVELKELCKYELLGGFTSDALGSSHVYSSEYENQVNLSEAVSRNTPVNYKCMEVSTAVKNRKRHTPNQVKQVQQDWILFKEAKFAQLDELILQIENATTEDEVNAIVWPTPYDDELTVRNAEAMAEAKRLEPENYK